MRGPAPGCLFLTADKKMLTHQIFYSVLSGVLSHIGHDPSWYITHSFRTGAATTAKDVGILDTHIKMLGRWESSAYQLYVRISSHQGKMVNCCMITMKQSYVEKGGLQHGNLAAEYYLADKSHLHS